MCTLDFSLQFSILIAECGSLIISCWTCMFIAHCLTDAMLWNVVSRNPKYLQKSDKNEKGNSGFKLCYSMCSRVRDIIYLTTLLYSVESQNL